MTICQRCHRPLKRPTESGLGPVCAKAVQPVPPVERDLFGYDIEAAVQSARTRLADFIEVRTWLAKQAVIAAFKDARKRLEVWP